jgi:hypothetical protein
MAKKILIGLSVSAIALVVACANPPATQPSSVAEQTNKVAAAADGSTFKIAAPVPVSPINNFQFASQALIVLTFSNVAPMFGSIAITYEIELKNAAGTLIANPKFAKNGGANATFTVTTTLTADSSFNWRVRATNGSHFGPWSSLATFRTSLGAFISGSTVVDPLTTGATVGARRGGHFVAGQGWQSDSTLDSIDYDITTCSNCRMEFDATNIGNGLGNPADLKWVSMGNRAFFNDFDAFKADPFKMTLEQRADFNGTGMKLVWRNGAEGAGNPGDHDTRLDTTSINWQKPTVFHFVLDWTPSAYFIQVNNQTMFAGAFSGFAYAPPNMRIQLGCSPRNESQVGVIYRNVTVTPR